MNRTPKSLRLHIGLLGRSNVGKSSLLNALTGQPTAIVSPAPGTTTDPVEKPMELLPLGPVVFVDTAGVDDTGSLGAMRVERTWQVLDRLDLAVLVVGGDQWGPPEEQLLATLEQRSLPYLLAFNQADVSQPPAELLERLTARGTVHVSTVAPTGIGLDRLREALIDIAPPHLLERHTIAADLVGPGRCALLVVPIDKEAPQGRLILPQVQTIRDLLDHHAFCMVTQESELAAGLAMLREPPALVVTDSQAFAEVAAITPREVPLTSFSILLSRLKGDLLMQVAGTRAVDRLRPGDRVLVAEACTHHPIGEDIGRVKIPRWLTERVGGPLRFEHVSGHQFPDTLEDTALVVLCGSCMVNRREVLSRMMRCRQAGVPVTNYGLLIAHCLGILDRALGPFPQARALWAEGLATGPDPQRGAHEHAA